MAAENRFSPPVASGLSHEEVLPQLEESKHSPPRRRSLISGFLRWSDHVPPLSKICVVAAALAPAVGLPGVQPAGGWMHVAAHPAAADGERAPGSSGKQPARPAEQVDLVHLAQAIGLAPAAWSIRSGPARGRQEPNCAAAADGRIARRYSAGPRSFRKCLSRSGSRLAAGSCGIGRWRNGRTRIRRQSSPAFSPRTRAQRQRP